MKIKSVLLKGFLKQSCMSGSAGVEECIVNFDEEGLKFLTTTAATLILMNAFLKKEKFEDYEKLGKLGIDNLSNVLKMLERIDSEDITIEKEKNILRFKGGRKKIELLLKDVEYIESPPVFPESLEHDVKFEVGSDMIKDFLSDVSVIGADKIILTTEAEKLLFIAKGQHTIKNLLDIEVKEDLKVEFNSLMVDGIENLSGNIKVGLKSGYPALFTNDFNGDGFIKVLIAPKDS